MKDFSDFDFKNHLNVFRVSVCNQVVGDVPLGSLENFLLCVYHANRGSQVSISLLTDSDSCGSNPDSDESGLSFER